MKAVSINDVTWQPYPGQRSTTTLYMPLQQGEEGDPSNYELAIVRIGEEGNFSPRHRHNFEQLRWAFKHPVAYSPGLTLPPGQLGYFPEGGYYGPFSLPPGTEWLIVQFGGLSRSGYMSWDQLMRGYTELKQVGEFKEGVFRKPLPNGKTENKDGYEAVWEHVHHNHAIKYPRARYREPIIMDPEAFEFIADAARPGVATRTLGQFGDKGPGAMLARLEGGASYMGNAHAGITLVVVVDGQILLEDKAYATRSSFALDPDEAVEFTASEDGAELLILTMPVFS